MSSLGRAFQDEDKNSFRRKLYRLWSGNLVLRPYRSRAIWNYRYFGSIISGLKFRPNSSRCKWKDACDHSRRWTSDWRRCISIYMATTSAVDVAFASRRKSNREAICSHRIFRFCQDSSPVVEKESLIQNRTPKDSCIFYIYKSFTLIWLSSYDIRPLIWAGGHRWIAQK